MRSRIYDWMMENMPVWLMYKWVWIDTQHKMCRPRFGWSKKQIKEAEERTRQWSSLFDNN